MFEKGDDEKVDETYFGSSAFGFLFLRSGTVVPDLVIALLNFFF